MKRKFTLLTLVFLSFIMQNVIFGQAPTLGTTSTFALFTAVGAFTNDGASMVTGDVGTNVGAFSAFPPGTLVGLKHVADPGSASAAGDVLTAYGFLFALTPLDVIDVNLGGPGEVTIGPGVHSIGAAATLNGTLTLDGGGDPNALFIFKINGALATAANSKVELINLANPCNVFWQINGQFDVATGSVFVGTVIASGPINLYVGSSLFGRGLTTAGAISVHAALVTIPVCGCSIAAPTTGAITQPDCFTPTGSVVLGGLPVGNWIINPGAIAGTGTSRTLSGLTAGTYNFTVTDDAGCISAPSGNVVINAFTFSPPFTAPTVISVNQPTCATATGSVVLGGLPSTGTWYINPGAIAGTGTTTTIYNLAAGTHNFTVTNASVCWTYSAPSADIVINAIVTAPTVTLTQPANCTSHTGTITVTGLTGDCYKYSIDGSNYSNTTGIFTSVPAGTYTVTAINPDGCISTGTSVTINGLPSYTAPTVGTITQPTCAVGTGSVVLNGLPATGNWFINPGGIAGTGTTATIYGLVGGTYNFTVTSPEVCWNYSAPSANIVINDVIVAAPTVSLTQPTTCVTPTGTITVTAPAGLHYSIDGSDYTNTSGVFAPVAPGTYLVRAQNADGCISSGTSVTINTQPVTVASATVQPTCTVATGTITVTAPAPGSGMTYSIDGSTYSNFTGIFLLVPAGTYTVTSKSSGGCISSGTKVMINAPGILAAPTASVTQPTTCVSPMGTITVTAPTGPGMMYSINGSTYTNTNGIFTSVAAGTYTVTAMNAAGCISSGTSVTINALPSTVATVTVQPTCTSATGTITVTAPTGSGMTYSIDGSTYTNSNGIFTLVPSGTYSVTSKSADGCISSVKSVTVNNQPASPAAPGVTLIQPTSTVPTGTITITLPVNCNKYSIDNVVYTNTTGVFSEVVPGSYTVSVKDWFTGCVSSGTAAVIIDYVTSIDIVKANSKFEIYPVPNNGQFIVVINSQGEKNFNITIGNALGSKVFEEKNVVVNGRLEHKIDMTGVPGGIYFIMFSSNDEKVVRKFTVLK